MDSRIAKALRVPVQPIATLLADEAPEGAMQFTPGRWGCVMWLAAAAFKGRAAGRVRRLRRAALSERVQVQREDDQELCAQYRASGFPTMLFRSTAAGAQDGGILVNGYRPLATLERVVDRVANGRVRHEPRAIGELLREYGPLTTTELGEITGQGAAVAESLRREAADGRITGRELRGGMIWERVDP